MSNKTKTIITGVTFVAGVVGSFIAGRWSSKKSLAKKAS